VKRSELRLSQEMAGRERSSNILCARREYAASGFHLSAPGLS
jgi:hypothetical protein